MNTEQQLARNGGQALVEALNFVTICRTLDPLGNYLHIGDLQWLYWLLGTSVHKLVVCINPIFLFYHFCKRYTDRG